MSFQLVLKSDALCSPR